MSNELAVPVYREATGVEILHLLSWIEADKDPRVDAHQVAEKIDNLDVRVVVLAGVLLMVYVVGNSWCNQDRYLVELYSKALSRLESRHIQPLSEAYNTLARNLGCQETQISTEMYSPRKLSVGRILQSKGFTTLGSTFSRRTDWGKS